MSGTNTVGTKHVSNVEGQKTQQGIGAESRFLAIRQNQRGAANQRRPYLPLGNIKTNTGNECATALSIHSKVYVMPVHQVMKRTVRNHHALRYTCGARGKYHIRGLIRRRQGRDTRITRQVWIRFVYRNYRYASKLNM